MQTTAQSPASAPVEDLQSNKRFPVWQSIVPFPPDDLLFDVGAQSVENFLVVADAWHQLVSRYLPDHAVVLDIGSGCGRFARTLINSRSVRKYVGFDVMPRLIAWCNRFIKPAWADVAEFHHFDLYSGHYNPKGTLRSEDLKFPVSDSTVDITVAGSLFTHLLEPDARHYLAEVGRVISRRGVALLSIHDQPAEGTRFSGAEIRIDMDPAYFVEMANAAGLREESCIPDFCGQRLFIFRRTQ